MTMLHVLSVFVDDDGAGGNPLGVFLDGAAIPASKRQPIAAKLGFSETVFVDEARTGELAIFTPSTELPFAGHPLVGAAWLLAQDRPAPPLALRPPAGEVSTRHEAGLTFIAARPDWAPPFEHLQLNSPGEVDALPGPPAGHDLAGCWAWEDEAGGVVRARVFPVRLGIEEDEATGSHALHLAAALTRPLVIHQGRGSTILARPLEDGRVEIGGRVSLLERRQWPEG